MRSRTAVTSAPAPALDHGVEVDHPAPAHVEPLRHGLRPRHRPAVARVGGRGEGEAGQGALVAARVGGTGVVAHRPRHLVAHPVHDPGPVDLLVRLRHVRVRAEDQVDVGPSAGGRPGEFPPQVQLLFVGRVLPLGPPVQRHHHDVGARPPGGPRVRRDPLPVDQVHGPGPVRRQRDAVRPVRVRQMRHLGAPDAHQGRLPGLLLGTRRARVAYARAIERVQRAPDAGRAVVQGVVGRRGARVVPRGREGLRHLGR